MERGGARLVAPVQIVETEHDRLCLQLCGEQIAQAAEQVLTVAVLGVTEDRRRGSGIDLAQRVGPERKRPDRFGLVGAGLEHPGLRLASQGEPVSSRWLLPIPGSPVTSSTAAAARMHHAVECRGDTLDFGVAAEQGVAVDDDAGSPEGAGVRSGVGLFRRPQASRFPCVADVPRRRARRAQAHRSSAHRPP